MSFQLRNFYDTSIQNGKILINQNQYLKKCCISFVWKSKEPFRNHKPKHLCFYVRSLALVLQGVYPLSKRRRPPAEDASTSTPLCFMLLLCISCLFALDFLQIHLHSASPTHKIGLIPQYARLIGLTPSIGPVLAGGRRLSCSARYPASCQCRNRPLVDPVLCPLPHIR